jgi:starch phosphorylase
MEIEGFDSLAELALDSRIANKGAVGKQVVDWRHRLEQKWATLHSGEVRVETKGKQHVFAIQVYLNDLDPKSVRLELYADGVNGGALLRQKMNYLYPLADESGSYLYSATVTAARPAADYVARVIPQGNGIAVPLESAQILWQR